MSGLNEVMNFKMLKIVPGMWQALSPLSLCAY